MKIIVIIVSFLATLGFAGGIEAEASIDPMAYEVVMQTWYGKISHKAKGHYCDTKNANAIIRKYNSNATRHGKAELKKAYRFYIFNNC